MGKNELDAKITERKGIFYSDCEINKDGEGFILKCKKGRPALIIKSKKFEKN